MKAGSQSILSFYASSLIFPSLGLLAIVDNLCRLFWADINPLSWLSGSSPCVVKFFLWSSLVFSTAAKFASISAWSLANSYFAASTDWSPDPIPADALVATAASAAGASATAAAASGAAAAGASAAGDAAPASFSA